VVLGEGVLLYSRCKVPMQSAPHPRFPDTTAPQHQEFIGNAMTLRSDSPPPGGILVVFGQIDTPQIC